MSATAKYFFTSANGRVGPIGFDELRALAVAGTLTRRQMVWCEGMSDWQPATSIPNLFDGLPPDLPAEVVPSQQPASPIVQCQPVTAEHQPPRSPASAIGLDRCQQETAANNDGGMGEGRTIASILDQEAPADIIRGMEEQRSDSLPKAKPGVRLSDPKTLAFVGATIVLGVVGGYSVLPVLQKITDAFEAQTIEAKARQPEARKQTPSPLEDG